MKKLTKISIDELKKQLPVLDKIAEQSIYGGSGDYGDPFYGPGECVFNTMGYLSQYYGWKDAAGNPIDGQWFYNQYINSDAGFTDSGSQSGPNFEQTIAFMESFLNFTCISGELDAYDALKSMSNDNIGGGKQAFAIVNGTHAVIVEGAYVEGNRIYYDLYDPTTGERYPSLAEYLAGGIYFTDGAI